MTKIKNVTWLFLAMGLLVVGSGCRARTAEECLEIANKHVALEDWKGALKYAKKATNLDPENVPALLFRALTAEKCGDRDLAESSAVRAVTLNPDSFVAQYTLGRIYSEDPTRYTEAISALLNALRLNREDANTLILLSNVSIVARSPKAISFLMALKHLQGYEDDPALNNQLGVCYVQRGNYKDAQKAFMAACSKATSNPDIIYNTAQFMDRHTVAKANARNLYHRFLVLTANHPEYAAKREQVTSRMNAMR